MCEVFQSAGHRAKGGEGRGQPSDQGLALSISLCSKIEPKKSKNSKFDRSYINACWINKFK